MYDLARSFYDLARSSNYLALHDLARSLCDLAKTSHDLARGLYDLARSLYDIAARSMALPAPLAWGLGPQGMEPKNDGLSELHILLVSWDSLGGCPAQKLD